MYDDPRSRTRSRALQSWKSGRFQKLSPPAFTMGAGNWPRILKLGHNIKIWWGRVFDIRSSFLCHVTLKSAQTSVAKSRPSVPGRGYFLFFVFQRGCHGSWPTDIPLNTPLILHSFLTGGTSIADVDRLWQASSRLSRSDWRSISFDCSVTRTDSCFFVATLTESSRTSFSSRSSAVRPTRHQNTATTRWKVLCESTTPHESNRRVFLTVTSTSLYRS